MFKKIILNILKIWYSIFSERRIKKNDFQRTTSKDNYLIFLKILNLITDIESEIIQTSDIFTIFNKKYDFLIYVKIEALSDREMSITYIETSPFSSIKERFSINNYAMIRIKEQYEQRKIKQISDFENYIKNINI
jgi:hypothetical protein